MDSIDKREKIMNQADQMTISINFHLKRNTKIPKDLYYIVFTKHS